MSILGRRNPLLVTVAACMLISACSGGTGACAVGFGVDTPAAQPSAGGGAAPVDPTAPPPRPKVVALGDSLTAGYGLVESESYPAILQARIDEEGYKFEVVNAGVSGDTSAGALRRLDWALDGDVKIMIVALGGNDGLRGLSVAEMKQNLSERARERNVIVILAGMEAPPNYGPEYVQSFRSAFREVALQQRVLFIPFLLDKVAGQGTLNQADGIHPNADGARVVADTVWSVLKPVLDQLVASS
jgi:acyl-CoA thioesterase I